MDNRENSVSNLRTWLQSEFSRENLPRSLSAALLLFLLEIILVVSFGALIFGDILDTLLPEALGYMIVGNAVILLLISFTSSYGGSFAVEQDAPAVILAVAVASLVASLPAASEAEIFSTIFALIVITTALMGLVFLFVGIFKLGALVRYFPYPVLGGFLAGTGWLLFVGGIGVIKDTALGFELFYIENLIYLAPGVFIALINFWSVRKWNNPISTALVFLGSLLIFYLFAWGTGYSIEELQQAGWLLGSFPNTAPWSFPINAERIAMVEWDTLVSFIPSIIPAILIGLIGFLLNASSLELVIKRDLDLNRELVVTGGANMISGLFGGLIGYHAISFSSLNHSLSKGKRLPGIISGLLLLLTLAVGMRALMYVPRFLLGGLLIYIGLELLFDWVVRVWLSFPKIDALIISAILVVVVAQGYLWGIGVGMVLTIILFLVNYSRVNVIRYVLPGTAYPSRLKRDPSHHQVLEIHGDKIRIFSLTGFIFFGTANHLYEEVRNYLQTPDGRSAKFIVFDFERVNGLDSTGLLSFEKLIQFTRERDVLLVLTGLRGRTFDQFTATGFTDDVEGLRCFYDLDQGAEWCETRLLEDYKEEVYTMSNLREQLAVHIEDRNQIQMLSEFMHRREIKAGQVLMRVGDSANEVIFLETGQLTIYLEQEDKNPIRLESLVDGGVVGELGFYLGMERTATVRADKDSVIYVIRQEDLERMQSDNPEAAHTLARIVIKILGERLVRMNQFIDALKK